jgi:hypothetical protein
MLHSSGERELWKSDGSASTHKGTIGPDHDARTMQRPARLPAPPNAREAQYSRSTLLYLP